MRILRLNFNAWIFFCILCSFLVLSFLSYQMGDLALILVAKLSFKSSTKPFLSKKFNECLPMPKMKTGLRTLPSPCANSVDLVWLIKSSIYRNSLRKSIRETWGNDNILFNSVETNNSIRRVKRLFLLGSSRKPFQISPLIEKEAATYKDILQGDFIDTYESVTQKVLTGLYFIAEFCKSAKFVIIADDDAVILPWNLYEFLNSNTEPHLLSGFFINHTRPVRLRYDSMQPREERWFLPTYKYSCDWFPEYPNGAMIVLSYKTALAVYDASLNYNYCSFDDVYIGGIAKDLSLPLTELPLNGFQECELLMKAHELYEYDDLMVCHGADEVERHNLLWFEFCHSTSANQEEENLILSYCNRLQN